MRSFVSKSKGGMPLWPPLYPRCSLSFRSFRWLLLWPASFSAQDVPRSCFICIRKQLFFLVFLPASCLTDRDFFRLMLFCKARVPVFLLRRLVWKSLRQRSAALFIKAPALRRPGPTSLPFDSLFTLEFNPSCFFLYLAPFLPPLPSCPARKKGTLKLDSFTTPRTPLCYYWSLSLRRSTPSATFGYARGPPLCPPLRLFTPPTTAPASARVEIRRHHPPRGHAGSRSSMFSCLPPLELFFSREVRIFPTSVPPG